MALITDIQKLEPGGEIRLFEIDGTEYGADYLRFHGHAIPHTPEELLAYEGSEEDLPAKSIIWQGRSMQPGRCRLRVFPRAAMAPPLGRLRRGQRQRARHGAVPGFRGHAQVQADGP
jgi:hypothetical protein